MTKREFLDKLAFRLSNIESRERNNILNYYDELLNDRIDEGFDEAKAINDLGTIDEIVRKLNLPTDDLKTEPYERIKYESVLNECKNSSTIQVEQLETKDPEQIEEKQTDNKKKINWALIIVVLVLTSPIWLVMMTGLFGLIGGIIGLLAGLFAGGFAIFISGFAVLASGIFSLTVNTWGGVGVIGLGIFIIGLGMALTPLLIKAALFIIKILVKGMKDLIAWIKGRWGKHEN